MPSAPSSIGSRTPCASTGLVQPLVVREADGGYELVDGERRYRARMRAAVTEARW